MISARLKDPFFISVTVAFVLLALLWGILLPMSEGPDEQNHYRYIMFLRIQHRLPRQLPLPPECPGQGHQPPLYYALGALALSILRPAAAYVELPQNPQVRFNENPIYFLHYREEGLFRFSGYAVGPHILRALQLLISLASLGLLWISLAALPGVGLPVQRLAFGFFTLNPGFVFLAGVLNNDHLLIFFFTLAVLLMTIFLEDGDAGPLEAAALGLVLGLGMLTKQSMLVLLPVAGLLVLLCFRRVFISTALLFGIVALVAGWFYWRNFSLYGDWSGWRMVKETCANTVHEKSITDLRWWWFWANRSFDSFFSVFGWFTWRLPLSFTFFCLGVLVLAGWGLAIKPSSGAREISYLLFACLALLVIAGIQFDLTFDPPEGRHYYPALAPLAGLTALGLSTWRISSQARLAVILSAALFLLNCWILFYRLIPLYYNV